MWLGQFAKAAMALSRGGFIASYGSCMSALLDLF
jgi:hypothetical protein